MKTKTTLQTPVAQVLHLSDFGLKSGGMTVSEVVKALELLKIEIGNNDYTKIANEVLINLRAMTPGMMFFFQKYFKGKRLKAFMVIAFRFIVEHRDYEFLSDYSAIRRTK